MSASLLVSALLVPVVFLIGQRTRRTKGHTQVTPGVRHPFKSIFHWAARVCWVSLKFSQFLGYSTDPFSVSSNLLFLMSLHSNSTSHHSNGFGRRHVDVRSIASMNYILLMHGLMNMINFLSNPMNPVASVRRWYSASCFGQTQHMLPTLGLQVYGHYIYILVPCQNIFGTSQDQELPIMWHISPQSVPIFCHLSIPHYLPLLTNGFLTLYMTSSWATTRKQASLHIATMNWCMVSGQSYLMMIL